MLEKKIAVLKKKKEGLAVKKDLLLNSLMSKLEDCEAREAITYDRIIRIE